MLFQLYLLIVLYQLHHNNPKFNKTNILGYLMTPEQYVKTYEDKYSSFSLKVGSIGMKLGLYLGDTLNTTHFVFNTKAMIQHVRLGDIRVWVYSMQ